MSHSEKEKLKVIIDKFLSNKIIRPSYSPYCLPIVLGNQSVTHKQNLFHLTIYHHRKYVSSTLWEICYP